MCVTVRADLMQLGDDFFIIPGSGCQLCQVDLLFPLLLLFCLQLKKSDNVMADCMIELPVGDFVPIQACQHNSRCGQSAMSTGRG